MGQLKVAYLQFEGAEFGPFTPQELQSVLNSKFFSGNLYVWFQGLDNWTPIKTMEELKTLLAKAIDSQVASSAELERLRLVHQGKDARVQRRFPLVATVWILETPQSKRVLGVCGDISEHGIQLITFATPDFEKDEKFKIEISSLSVSGLPTLTAQCQVSWVKPLERRAGLAFEGLTESQIKSISRYLQACQNRMAKIEIQK